MHDHTTVYTLTVTNNHGAATTGAGVVDLIPAGPGVPRLRRRRQLHDRPGVPRRPVPGRDAAASRAVRPRDSVSTVDQPCGRPGRRLHPRRVDARATSRPTRWSRSGTPPASRSGPTPRPGPGDTPTPASLGQTANLDNNTGPSTRETATEQAYTNHATVTGDYTGPVAPGTGTPGQLERHRDGHAPRTCGCASPATPDTFVQGGVQRYTLTIDTSEYADASDIVVTDHLPNGMCPLDDVQNYVTGAPADCDPSAAFAPDQRHDHQRRAERRRHLRRDVLAADDRRQRQHADPATPPGCAPSYTGGDNAGDPTSSGDTFTNTAHLTATTNPAPGVDPPAPTGRRRSATTRRSR